MSDDPLSKPALEDPETFLDLEKLDEVAFGLDAEDTDFPDIPTELSLMPLRDSVIYPKLIAPLSVSREPGVHLIDDSLAQERRIIGVVTQKDPNIESPGFDDVHPVGCAVIIRTLVKMPEATRLIVQGLGRFRIVEQTQSDPYMRARIEVIPEPAIPAGKEEEVEAMKRSIAAMFDHAIRLSPHLPDELRSLTETISEPNVMADLVAAHMPLPSEVKQSVLEEAALLPRMKKLLQALAHEVRILELSSKVQGEVNAELSKSQRDFYLREQLKAIQRELGELDDRPEDLDEFRKRIAEAGMSAEALKEANREFDRLRRINPGSPEYTVARTYLETMLALPWTKSTADHLDLREVEDVLDREHFGLKRVKQRILDFLAVRKLKGDAAVRQPILCFVGPPGVGKTSLGKSIATAMGRKFVRASLGGMRDEAEIRGHRRTYIGALPGQIIQGIRRSESNNPVFVLDEIDKLGNDFRGDPSSALLEVLDPEQNFSFRDHYLDVPFDLSKVFFIATANRLDTIPAALRDRMEIIELGGYTEHEKLEIAKAHLLPKQVVEHGLTQSKAPITTESLQLLISGYTREAGVRNLDREIAGLYRHAARRFAEGRRQKLIITPKIVQEALGVPKYQHDAISERKMVPGVAVGLAWTPVGGDVLFIEVAKMTGTKGLTVTGQLGDVMRESVTAALTYVRSHAAELGIEPEAFDSAEIHVHVPAGAVPKDGPSAGITMLCALVSLFTNRPIAERVAMTGEITLTGTVLPVGGIKEKVIAAHRAGVRTLILPEENRKDFDEDVPMEVRQDLKVSYVADAVAALSVAFPSIGTKKRRKAAK